MCSSDLDRDSILQALIRGFSLDYLQDVEAHWDCARAQAVSKLNYFSNFEVLAGQKETLSIQDINELFLPIPPLAFGDLVSHFLQVALVPVYHEGSDNTEHVKARPLTSWGSCDFCQALRFALFADHRQRYNSECLCVRQATAD